MEGGLLEHLLSTQATRLLRTQEPKLIRQQDLNMPLLSCQVLVTMYSIAKSMLNKLWQAETKQNMQ